MSAITPATAAPTHPAKPPATSLAAEKAKCESQLADWVHCVSATTPEGKAKIEEFSAKLNAINAKIKQAGDARAEVAPVSAARSLPTETVGNMIDVYA